MESNPVVLRVILHQRSLSAIILLVLVFYRITAAGDHLHARCMLQCRLNSWYFHLIQVCWHYLLWRWLQCVVLGIHFSWQFIKWSILQANEQGTLIEPVNPVRINSRDDIQMAQRVITSSTFTFTRTSAQVSSPLNPILSIDSVSIGLNGTVVRCSDVLNPTTPASTTIQITDISQSELHYILDFMD